MAGELLKPIIALAACLVGTILFLRAIAGKSESDGEPFGDVVNLPAELGLPGMTRRGSGQSKAGEPEQVAFAQRHNGTAL